MGYYKLLTPAILLRDIDLIKDVLMKDHFSFHVNEQYFSKRFDPLMEFNPFVATGDTWRRARSILTPLLTLHKVRTLHPLIADSCDKLVGYLKNQPANKDFEAKTVSNLQDCTACQPDSYVFVPHFHSWPPDLLHRM